MKTLNEEIRQNLAIVYHRGSKNKLKRLLNKTYVNQNHIDFASYGDALYTTYNMESQLNQVGNLNNMKQTYGNVVIKLFVKGVKNFWYCDYEEYAKSHNCTIDNWKQQQLEYFKIPEKFHNILLGSDKDKTANHVRVSHFFEQYKFLGTRVKGIQYAGSRDGNCLLIYDWTTAVPLSYTTDEGKTWKTIDRKKIEFQKRMMRKNENIETNNKIEPTNLKGKYKNEYSGDLEISGEKNSAWYAGELISLEGMPQVVKGNVELTNLAKIKTLEGMPQIIFGNLYIWWLKNLESLKCNLKEIKGDLKLDSRSEKLEANPEEILNFLLRTKIHGKIEIESYFRNKKQKEAIKILEAEIAKSKEPIKEGVNYFPY